MTQEDKRYLQDKLYHERDKELLLKDLCARLPYSVRIEYNGEMYDVLGIAHGRVLLCKPFSSKTEKDCPLVEGIKPYLFPLSSMTDEQLKDLGTYYAKDSKNIIDDAIKSLESPSVMYKAAHVCFNTQEWYNENHFDYRGLIEKGLALDATGLNIY